MPNILFPINGNITRRVESHQRSLHKSHIHISKLRILHKHKLEGHASELKEHKKNLKVQEFAEAYPKLRRK